MTPKEYREKAAEIRARAEKALDPEVRREWLAIARQYEQLAATMELRRFP